MILGLNGVIFKGECMIFGLHGGFSKRKCVILGLNGVIFEGKCMIFGLHGGFPKRNGVFSG